MTKDSITEQQNLQITASGAPSKPLYTIFTISAILGITGWLFLICLFIYWTLESPTYPTVTEPIPVLNANNEVAIGDELRMTFNIVKPVDIGPTSSSRYFECRSGNLVTFTSTPINLPVGTYELAAEGIVVPNKVSADDICVFVIQATYQVNPLKQHTDRFRSEPFLILPKQGDKE